MRAAALTCRDYSEATGYRSCAVSSAAVLTSTRKRESHAIASLPVGRRISLATLFVCARGHGGMEASR